MFRTRLPLTGIKLRFDKISVYIKYDASIKLSERVYQKELLHFELVFWKNLFPKFIRN